MHNAYVAEKYNSNGKFFIRRPFYKPKKGKEEDIHKKRERCRERKRGREREKDRKREKEEERER